jgi:hypothetical protein
VVSSRDQSPDAVENAVSRLQQLGVPSTGVDTTGGKNKDSGANFVSPKSSSTHTAQQKPVPAMATRKTGTWCGFIEWRPIDEFTENSHVVL